MQGRKRAPANVELVEADATALPYELGSFDLVCTARALHHVPRPELVLAEMNRVLRPGVHARSSATQFLLQIGLVG